MRATYPIILVSCLLIAVAISSCCHRPVYFVVQQEELREVNMGSLFELHSQFGKSEGVVTEMEYFATPVIKTESGSGKSGSLDDLSDSVTHLTWYRYREWPVRLPGLTRKVIFTNQFFSEREQEWEISMTPAYLLVPTDKDKVPGRNESMHFLCYKVLDPKPSHYDDFTLWDQIEPEGEDIKILLPKYFCIPVEKTREGISSGSVDLYGEHLACYEVRTQQGDLADRRPVTISNQFDTDWRDLILRETYMLCVPSRKVEVEVITKPVFE